MAVALPIVAFGAVVAVAVAGGVAAWRAAQRRRREALEHFALARGMRYESSRRGAEEAVAPWIPFFGKGHSRRWGHTLSGVRNGFPCTAFEYRWATGGGQHTQHHRVHGVLWERTEGEFPKFTLAPEGVLQRIGQLLGMKDIDFDADPEFSRRYVLKSQDEAAARRLFTVTVRSALTAGDDRVHLAAGGRYLVWYARGRLPAAERLDDWLEAGDRVRRLFLSGGR
jgi:hypothetical protein